MMVVNVVLLNVLRILKITFKNKIFLIRAIMLSECVCVFSFLEWTCGIFPRGKLGTFTLFKFPNIIK